MKSAQGRGIPLPAKKQPGREPPTHMRAIVQAKQTSGALNKRQPVAPPVYRPQPQNVQQKTAGTSQTRPSPVAPPVYRPQPVPKVLQTKTLAAHHSVNQSKRVPAAPAVYLPQPVPKVLQTKSSSAQGPQAGPAPGQPIVPPVYRPEAKKVVQPKAILRLRTAPTAPPVYRPEQKRVAQPQQAAAQACRPAKASPAYRSQPGQVSLKPCQLAQMKLKGIPQPQSEPQPVGSHHSQVQPRPAGRGAIQRVIAPMDDKTLTALAGMHALGRDKEIGASFTEDEIKKMKDGTYLLTGFHGAVNCNCFGWALGQDLDTKDKGSIYLWKKEHGGKQNFTDPDSESAKIILWGDKEGEDDEDKWDVLHASVKLTHAELLSRSGQFKGLVVTKKALDASGIPNPFWSSAGGMGYGIFVHPRNWFAGGDFGVALKGMKAAI